VSNYEIGHLFAFFALVSMDSYNQLSGGHSEIPSK